MRAGVWVCERGVVFRRRASLTTVVLMLLHSIPDIDKKKFLAPADITVAKFVSEIRKHIKLGRQESLFVFVEGNVMPQPNATMSQVYAQHRDEDGFLYIVFSSENAFGCDGL